MVEHDGAERCRKLVLINGSFWLWSGKWEDVLKNKCRIRRLRQNFTEQQCLQLLWAAVICPLDVWRKAPEKVKERLKGKEGGKRKGGFAGCMQQSPRARWPRCWELLEGAALQRRGEGGCAAERRGGGRRRPRKGQRGCGAGLGASRRRWPRGSGKGERTRPPAPPAVRAWGWAPGRELRRRGGNEAPTRLMD